MEADWRGSSAPSSPLSRVPPAPRTPSPRARTLIFRYQGAQFVIVLVGGIFFAVGLLFTLIFCWGLPGDLALAISSHEVEGEILESHLARNVKINGRHPTRIRFRYREDGVVREGESSTLDPGALDIAGASVPIEVSGPYARVRGASYSTFGWGASFVVLFPLVGAALAGAAWRSNRREIRAFTDGKATLAKVTFFGADTTTRINGRHPVILRWEFSVAGQRYDGSISALDPALLEEQAGQAEVVVLYDPVFPSINTIYVS